MAVINVCGFETGDSTEALSTAGTFSVQAVTKRTGGYALRCNPAVSAAGYQAIGGVAATGEAASINRTAETFYTCYINFATLPSSGSIRFLGVQSTSTVVVRLSINSAGQISLIGTSTVSVGSPISTGTWYRIDLRVTSNGTSGCAIDGGTEATVTANNVTQNEFTIGRRVTSEAIAFDCYYDDIYISDTAFPGAGEVRALRPDGDGTYTAWASGTGTTFAEVDDDAPGHDSDTTYVKALDTGDNTARTFSMTSTATAGVAGAIKTAKLHGVCRTESTSLTSTVGVRLRSNTTDSDTTGREWTTLYVGYSKLFDTDPATGSAWTTGGLDAVEGGVYAGTIAQAQRATAFWLMVWAAGATGDVSETVTGASTPTGALSTAIVPPTLTGGITPSGTETDALGVAATGAITPAGALTTPDIAVAQAGTVTQAGAVAEDLGITTITGAVTPAGDVTPAIAADVAGTVTPTGDGRVTAFTQGADGAVTPSGDVTGALSFTALGSTSPSGDVGQSIAMQPAGDITPTGTVGVVVTPGVVPPTPAPAPAATADDQGVIFVSDGWPYTEAPREIVVEVQRPIEVWRRGVVTPAGRVTVEVDQSPLYRKQAQDLMLMGVL